MIVLKGLLLAFATKAQAGGAGAFTRSKNGADKQNFGVCKDRLENKGAKATIRGHQLGRQGQHTKTFLGRKSCSLLSLPFLFQRTNWIKSSSEAVWKFCQLCMFNQEINRFSVSKRQKQTVKAKPFEVFGLQRLFKHFLTDCSVKKS